MKKMAFVATGYILRYDGVSVYLENLLRALLSKRGHDALDIDVYCGRDAIGLLKQRVLLDAENAEGIRFIAVADDSFIKKTVDTTFKLFRNGSYDLVFMPNFMPLLVTPGKRLKVVHDFSIRRHPELFSRFTLLYNYFLIKTAYWFDSAIGYISEATKQDLDRFFHINDSNKRLVYLPNGVPFKVSRHPRPAMGSAIEKYRSGSLELAVVGRINMHKGFDRILKFCNYLDRNNDATKRFEKITLHIVGKQTAETAKIFQDQSFKHIHLNFHGFVDDDALNQIYRNVHFNFFLSRNEGYGLPLIETMWFCTIPILSDIPIFREVTGDALPKFSDQTGYETAIWEFIARVFDDQEYLETLLQHLDTILEYEAKGYERAAENLLRFMENPGCVSTEADSMQAGFAQ